MRTSAPAACLLLAASCARAPVAGAPTAARRVLLDVPFFPDRGEQCGPSALASVLRYWGGAADPAGLEGELYRPALKGSLTVDLLLAAEERGMSARLLEGSLPALKRELDAGRPLIALLNLGLASYPVGHYVVVTGYDDLRRGVYAHSGARRDAFMPYARFDRLWGRSGRWALALSPSGR